MGYWYWVKFWSSLMPKLRWIFSPWMHIHWSIECLIMIPCYRSSFDGTFKNQYNHQYQFFFQKTLHVHRFLFLRVYVDLPPVCDQRNEVLEDRSATWIEERQKWMDLSIQHAETIKYRCCWPVEIPIEIRVSALIMFATWINHQRWGWKHQKRHGLILKSHGTTMKKPRIFFR